MKVTKKRRLEAAGWKVADAKQFLGLSDEETLLIELKIDLAASLRKRRRSKNLSQRDVAGRLGSSQSRVAKMEGADPSVSIELLLKSLFSLGATRRDIARVIGTKTRRQAA